jgi:hypothetical protein
MERVEIESNEPAIKDESLSSVLEGEYTEPAIYKKREEPLRLSVGALFLCLVLIAIFSLAALRALGFF